MDRRGINLKQRAPGARTGNAVKAFPWSPSPGQRGRTARLPSTHSCLEWDGPEQLNSWHAEVSYSGGGGGVWQDSDCSLEPWHKGC